MTYWTDVDLHAQPDLLVNHRCLFSWVTTSTGPSPCARGRPRPTPAASTSSSWGRTPATARSGCSRPPSAPTACRRVTRTPPRIRWLSRILHSRRSTGSRPTQQPRVDPHRLHVPISRRQGEHGGHHASSWFYGGCNLDDGHTFSNVILGEYDRYVPARDRRDPPHHGERLQPLRPWSCHLVRQLDGQLVRRLHRGLRRRRDRHGHGVRLKLPLR